MARVAMATEEARTEAACMAARGRSAEALAPTVVEDFAVARQAVPAVTLRAVGPHTASARASALGAVRRLVPASPTETFTPSAADAAPQADSRVLAAESPMATGIHSEPPAAVSVRDSALATSAALIEASAAVASVGADAAGVGEVEAGAVGDGVGGSVGVGLGPLVGGDPVGLGVLTGVIRGGAVARTTATIHTLAITTAVLHTLRRRKRLPTPITATTIPTVHRMQRHRIKATTTGIRQLRFRARQTNTRTTQDQTPATSPNPCRRSCCI